MLTISGSDNLYANSICNTGPHVIDHMKELQGRIAAAKQIKEELQTDHTWDLIQSKGYLEKLGPDKIYLSQTAKNFTADADFYKVVCNYRRKISYLIINYFVIVNVVKIS
jgi:hypothetical protein